MPPTTPGSIAPGLDNSNISPYIPMIINIYAMLGSLKAFKILSLRPISILTRSASFVLNTLFPPSVTTSRPSIWTRRSSMLDATRSIILRSNASFSVTETLDLTASSAHFTFLPLFSAIDFMYAAASFSTFFFISLSISPPPKATGWAAPIFVPGVMAAICEASVMKTPAEADLAPEG